MDAKESSKGAIGTGILAALAASSCCIPPIVAAIAGVGGISSSLSWMEPLRPYMVGLAVVAIGYAWYSHLKPKTEDDCGCEIEKPKFYQTRGFLVGITLFAAVSITLPYYSHIFFGSNESKVVYVETANVQQADFNITGMTCEGCTEHIKHAVAQLPGFIEADASYEEGSATVKFDKSKSTIEEVVAAINETGYTVEDYKINQ